MHEARDPVTARDLKDSSFVRSVYKRTEERTTPVGWERTTLGEIVESRMVRRQALRIPLIGMDQFYGVRRLTSQIRLESTFGRQGETLRWKD